MTGGILAAPRVGRRTRVVALLLAAIVLAAGCGSSSSGGLHSTASVGGSRAKTKAAPRSAAPVSLAYKPLYSLAAAVQDPAAAAVGNGRFVLLGGLDAADTSTANVIVGSQAGAAVRAALPNAQHDAEAADLGGRVYVFGGGQFSQYDHILAFDPAAGAITTAGTLPAPESDVAVTGDGTTAYVAGGFDGTNALDTIVAWRPGGAARVVGHLPTALRYAAVAMVHGAVLIAGGSTPSGEASATVYRFTPATGRVAVLGHLPQPLTHAGAAVLRGTLFLVGGRGADTTSRTASVLAVDPLTGAVRRAGRLPARTSDAGVVALGGVIVVAGGRTAAGTQASVGELVPSG